MSPAFTAALTAAFSNISLIDLGAFQGVFNATSSYLNSHWKDFKGRVLNNVNRMATAVTRGIPTIAPLLLNGIKNNRDVPVILDLPSEPSFSGVPNRPTIRIPFALDLPGITLVLQSDRRPGRFFGIGFTGARLKTPLQSDLQVRRLLQIDYQAFGQWRNTPSGYRPHFHAVPKINTHQFI